MALDFGNKVENGGIPPQGVLTATEFNTLVEQVNKNESDIAELDTPNSIESITVEESSESGGTNVVTITETNGTETTVNVKNGVNGVSLGDVQIADNCTTNDATKVLSAKQGKNLMDAINSYTFVFDKADFGNIFAAVGDIGIHARINPSALTTLIPTDSYRCFWVKANKGDTICTWTRGYTDNVSLGFSATRTLTDLTSLDATSNEKQRSATASADGYFLVGMLYAQSGTPRTNRVWVIPPADVVKEYSLSTTTDENLYLVAISGKTATIATSSGGTKSITIPIKRGEKVTATFSQYNDTASYFFTKSEPQSGDTAVSLLTSAQGATSRTVTAPEDGYVTLSYIASSGISNLKIGTPYLYRECETLASQIGALSVEITSFDEGIKKKGWQILSSNNLVQDNISGQDSYLFHVAAGDHIKVKGVQWSDTALLAFSSTMPSVGDEVTILYNGSNSLSALREYTFTAAGYAIVTLRNKVSQEGATIQITSRDYALRTTVEKLEGANEVGASASGLNIEFESLSMDAAGAMSSYSADDIITNIYEPLRTAHPEYITRRSLGKDASNLYDIWLYEFNNSVDEWFALGSKGSDVVYNVNCITEDLESYQFRLSKSWFDSNVPSDHMNLYVESDYTVRKPVLCNSYVEETIDGTVYYKFSCDDTSNSVKVLTNPTSGNKGVRFFWTTKINTYDQHILLVSGVHGNEPTGYLGLALALKYLVEHHTDNKMLNYIYNHVKISVIPCLNVWGANQSTKVRTNVSEVNLNVFGDTLTAEQQILADYADSVKDELSFYLDLHTAENWSDYGMVYATTPLGSKLLPALTMTSGYLCKHWFPELPPFNWNIGQSGADAVTSSKYVKSNYNVESATVEFCGYDLRYFGNCDKWSAKYMTYAVENYVNFILATCALRLKSNAQNIIDNTYFGHTTMS